MYLRTASITQKGAVERLLFECGHRESEQRTKKEVVTLTADKSDLILTVPDRASETLSRGTACAGPRALSAPHRG